MSINFTFDLISGSGIADQLGAQFAHLYTLGVKCGWNYKHLKAIALNRSLLSSLLCVPRKRRAAKKLSEILGFHLPVLRNGGLSPDALAEYLGLGVSSLDEVSPHTKVPLDDLLGDSKSIDEIKIKVINGLQKGCGGRNASSDPLLWVTIDRSFHSKLDRIQRLLGMSYEQVLDFAGETFLKPRLSDKQARPLITGYLHKSDELVAVIHLRLGDSLYLATPKGCIILHGVQSYQTVSDFFKKVKTVDPGRTPWFDPYLVSYQVQRELTTRGICLDRCYLISDGFELSRKALNIAGSRTTTPRDLFVAAKRKIDELEQQFSRAFHWIPRKNRVIGEGDYETIQSIELIRFADLILCNNGGFSYVIHRLYKERKFGTSFVFLNRERLL
jgi:hypothetical protein